MNLRKLKKAIQVESEFVLLATAIGAQDYESAYRLPTISLKQSRMAN